MNGSPKFVSRFAGVRLPMPIKFPAQAGSEVTTVRPRDMPSLGLSSLDCPAPASAASGALSEGSA